MKVAAAWWSGLAAKPALQGNGPPSPGGSLPAVALTAKAVGVIERDEAELPERSRGARAGARARSGCVICYDIFCIL